MPSTQILTTERLQLRKMESGDVNFIGQLLSSDEVMRFYPKFIIDAGPQSWLERNFARYEKDGIGGWIAVRKSDQVPIGQIGLSVQDVNGRPEPEVGYLLHRSFWGLGYATEAAKGCIRYGLDSLKYDRIVALILEENAPSRAVAERLGLVHDGEAEHGGMMHRIYATKKREIPSS